MIFFHVPVRIRANKVVLSKVFFQKFLILCIHLCFRGILAQTLLGDQLTLSCIDIIGYLIKLATKIPLKHQQIPAPVHPNAN